VPQLRNRPKPHLMCGARRRFCVGVAVGHDDEAQNADFWRGNVAVQSIRVVPMYAPCPSVRVGVLAHRCRGAETDEIKAMPAGIFDAGRRVSRVPQWRIGLLQRMQFDRDVPVTSRSFRRGSAIRSTQGAGGPASASSSSRTRARLTKRRGNGSPATAFSRPARWAAGGAKTRSSRLRRRAAVEAAPDGTILRRAKLDRQQPRAARRYRLAPVTACDS